MKIRQFSQQITTQASSSEGFVRNTVDNPKKENCKAIELSYRVIPKDQKVSVI